MEVDVRCGVCERPITRAELHRGKAAILGSIMTGPDGGRMTSPGSKGTTWEGRVYQPAPFDGDAYVLTCHHSRELLRQVVTLTQLAAALAAAERLGSPAVWVPFGAPGRHSVEVAADFARDVARRP